MYPFAVAASSMPSWVAFVAFVEPALLAYVWDVASFVASPALSVGIAVVVALVRTLVAGSLVGGFALTPCCSSPVAVYRGLVVLSYGIGLLLVAAAHYGLVCIDV